MYYLEIVFTDGNNKDTKIRHELTSKKECENMKQMLIRPQMRMSYKSFKIGQITVKSERTICSWDNEKYAWFNRTTYRSMCVCDIEKKDRIYDESD